MRRILIEHASRYPRWGVEDLYKLIYQAAMGSEHAVSDEDGVRDWLVQEMATLGHGPDEPLVDPISPDGAVVRVHLRPFVRQGLHMEQLLQAFIRTAKEFQGSAERLREYGDSAARWAGEAALPFSAEGVSAFIAEMEARGFPAVHHSAVFEAEYCPAYRVVARMYLPSEITAAA